MTTQIDEWLAKSAKLPKLAFRYPHPDMGRVGALTLEDRTDATDDGLDKTKKDLVQPATLLEIFYWLDQGSVLWPACFYPGFLAVRVRAEDTGDERSYVLNHWANPTSDGGWYQVLAPTHHRLPARIYIKRNHRLFWERFSIENVRQPPRFMRQKETK